MDTKVNIRIDMELKEQADKLFSSLGMNMSTAFNVFIRQAVREQAIPFKIELYSNPSKLTIEALREVENNKLDSFNSIDDLMNDLKD